MNEPRIIQIRRQILKENDLLALRLRKRFHKAGVYVISIVSGPGSGKTTLLARLLSNLSRQQRVAAIVGDLATENDASRLARSGAPVKQITTGTICHLDAGMIERAVADWNLESFDFLFIENVGNLVCPSSFDLGENMRLVMVSTTEGEDKPLKYPTIFNTADVAVITKLDLADAAAFEETTLIDNIHNVRPGMPILKVSARTGEGVAEMEQLLLSRRNELLRACTV